MRACDTRCDGEEFGNVGGGTVRWDLRFGDGLGEGVTQRTTKRGYLALHDNNDHLLGLATPLDSWKVKDRARYGTA